MARIKKCIFLLLFLATTTLLSASPVSFLPMEDGFSPMRVSVYGVSIENTKPFRQAVAIEPTNGFLNHDFEMTDLLIGLSLLGIYFLFANKRARSRNAGF